MGSNPIRVVLKIEKYFISGILAQLGEHLPYKQRVTGSSPVGPIWRVSHVSMIAVVAELADAQDLKSCGTNLPCRFDSGLRHLRKKAWFLPSFFYFQFSQFSNSIASGCNQQKNMLPWIYVIDVKSYRHVNAYETGESRTRYRGCICPAFFWLHAQLPKSP